MTTLDAIVERGSLSQSGSKPAGRPGGATYCEFGGLMAEPTRLELATSGVTVRCANQLHHGSAAKTGGRYRTRTSDPLRVKQVLYQLS